MPAAPQNTDISSAYMLPGVYVQLNLAGSGAALNNVQKRAAIFGYKLASGTKPSNTPVLVVGQQQADQYAGRGSDCARNHAAFLSQIGGGQCDIYLFPLDEPVAGAQSTYALTIIGTATQQDSITFRICGYLGSVAISSGDTPTIIAAALSAAINAILDIPCTASPSAGVVTITYRHKGIVGEDLPILANVLGSSGVSISPGTLTLAGTGVGAGSITLSCGATTYSAAITGGDTASIIAGNLAAAINATNGPLLASALAGVVTLTFAQDRDVRRISAAIITTTGVTPTLAVGTPGTGLPTLSTALAVAAAQPTYACWSSCFNDVATLGTLDGHIETYANGLYQKGQKLFAASTQALSVAGAIPVGTSPALTASPRPHFGWCPDAAVQAHELSARHAARVLVEDFKPRNYDGVVLQSQTASVPLPLPHVNSRASQDSNNSALRTYFMTPYGIDGSNNMVIVRSRTTSNAADARLWDTGCIDTADWTRYDYQVSMGLTFKGKSLKTVGTPKTPNTISPAAIGDFVISRMFKQDDADFLDGADQLKAAVLANINVLSPTRADVYIPFRPPAPLHILAPVLGLV